MQPAPLLANYLRPRTVSGDNGNDTISGFGGNDRRNGGNINDILLCGTGSESMHGGVGDDRYYVDHANGTVTDTGGNDLILITTIRSASASSACRAYSDSGLILTITAQAVSSSAGAVTKPSAVAATTTRSRVALATTRSPVMPASTG
jgi:Ca2+-binding RTX toxin-like protein